MKIKSCLIGLGGLLFLLPACFSDLCGSTIIYESVSPGQKYIATVYEWDCGATTSFYRVINLRTYGSDFDGGNQDERIYSLEGQLDVNAVWASKDELKVFYPAGTDPHVKTTWHDVRISFQKR
jgi:hypothetical protein